MAVAHGFYEMHGTAEHRHPRCTVTTTNVIWTSYAQDMISMRVPPVVVWPVVNLPSPILIIIDFTSWTACMPTRLGAGPRRWQLSPSRAQEAQSHEIKAQKTGTVQLDRLGLQVSNGAKVFP